MPNLDLSFMLSALQTVDEETCELILQSNIAPLIKNPESITDCRTFIGNLDAFDGDKLWIEFCQEYGYIQLEDYEDVLCSDIYTFITDSLIMLCDIYFRGYRKGGQEKNDTQKKFMSRRTKVRGN